MKRSSEAILLEGRLTAVRRGWIFGWAWDRSGPDNAEEVDISVDGNHLGRFRAGDMRTELLRKGIGTGQHAFRVPLPGEVLDGQQHTIRATFVRNGEELAGSPLTAVCEPTIENRSERQRFVGAPNVGKAMALVGKDNWTFLCNTRTMEQLAGRIRLSPRQLDDYKASFRARNERFRALGIPYVFAPVPMKELIYREYLPDDFYVSDTPFPLDQLLELFRDEPGIDVLDLRPVLKEAKRHEQVYYRTDTHCNMLGGYHVYRALLKEASRFVPGLEPYPIDHFSFVQVRRFRGDLSDKEKMGIDDNRVVPVAPPLTEPILYRERIKDVDREALRSREVPLDEIPPEYKVSPTRRTMIFEIPDAPELPTAVVMRDSFTEQVIPYLSEHFRRVVYVWVPNPPFSVIESEKPDVCLQLMAERFLIRSPLMPGWEHEEEPAVGFEPTAEPI